MSKTKNNKKLNRIKQLYIENRSVKYTIVIALFVLIIGLGTLLAFSYSNRNDIYYRTYTKEHGWTKWSKNGEASGNDKDITAIQIRTKTKIFGNIDFKSYYGTSWEKEEKHSEGITGNKKDSIKIIRMVLSGSLNNKYNIKYRLLRNNKKWSDWAENGLPLLNNNKGKEDSIKQIEIKLEKK